MHGSLPLRKLFGNRYQTHLVGSLAGGVSVP